MMIETLILLAATAIFAAIEPTTSQRRAAERRSATRTIRRA